MQWCKTTCTSADSRHSASVTEKPGECFGCHGGCSGPGHAAWCRTACTSAGSVKSESVSTTAPCFSKETATACRLAGPAVGPAAAFEACYKNKGGAAVAQRVPMAALSVGDHVPTSSVGGELAATRVVVNQHASASAKSPMLTLHTARHGTVSLTPDHAIYVDGALAAASEAKVGSHLMTADGESAAVTRVVASVAEVINPVTATGTILASDEGAPNEHVFQGVDEEEVHARSRRAPGKFATHQHQ